MKTKLSHVKNKPEWNVTGKAMFDVPEVPAFEFLRQSAKRYPQKPVLISFGRATAYHELDELSDRLANALIEMGVKKGDRVGFYLPNCLEAIISFYGILKTGAYLVTLNIMLKEDEVAYQLSDYGSKTIITLDRLYPTVKRATGQYGLEHIILTNLRDWAEPGASIPAEFDCKKMDEFPQGVHDFAEIIKKASSEPPDVSIKPKEDLAVILYTSGTTGKAKGAMLTHYCYSAASLANPIRQGWKEDDVTLLFFPIFHVGCHGLTLCPAVMMGMTLVNVCKFDPREALGLIEKYRVTTAHIPPTGFIGLLRHPDFDKYDLSSLWYCACGGSPLPPALVREWKERTGVRMLNAYGCTENTGLGGGACQETLILNRENCAGTVNFELKIVDDEGNIVPRGVRGEIVHGGPGVALGYWNKPEETEKSFPEPGWWRSGDLGYIDDDDFVYVVDRHKDLIITSGYNVAPAEVEATILSHEAVSEVCVYGIPDVYRGEAVKAAVVLKEASKGRVSEQDLIDYCREKMAKYKAPRFVEFVEEIPKTSSGKMLRRVLRDREAKKL